MSNYPEDGLPNVTDQDIAREVPFTGMGPTTRMSLTALEDTSAGRDAYLPLWEYAQRQEQQDRGWLVNQNTGNLFKFQTFKFVYIRVPAQGWAQGLPSDMTPFLQRLPRECWYRYESTKAKNDPMPMIGVLIRIKH